MNLRDLMPHRHVLLQLMVLAILVLAVQYVTTAKLAVFPPGVSFATPSRFIYAVRQEVDITAFDAALVLAAVVVCLTLLAGELTGGRISTFLRSALATDARAVCLLAAGSLVLSAIT